MFPRVPAGCCSLALLWMATACSAPGAGTYCQSGSKYGTQCYSAMDVQQAPGSPPPAVRFMELGKPAAPSTQKPWMPSITYAPGASAPGQQPALALAPLPAALTCDGDPTQPAFHPPPPDTTPTASPGQLTVEAAQARRLYDQEKWNEAIVALGRVADGTTGDDDGNRQIAEYQLALALYHAGQLSASYAKLSAIAGRRNHIKHAPTLLWLTKFAQTHPEFVRIADFATYSWEDVALFNNAQQHPLVDVLNYLIGRERLQEGSLALARDFLARVPATHPYGPSASKCLSVIQASSGGR